MSWSLKHCYLPGLLNETEQSIWCFTFMCDLRRGGFMRLRPRPVSPRMFRRKCNISCWGKPCHDKLGEETRRPPQRDSTLLVWYLTAPIYQSPSHLVRSRRHGRARRTGFRARIHVHTVGRDTNWIFQPPQQLKLWSSCSGASTRSCLAVFCLCRGNRLRYESEWLQS